MFRTNQGMNEDDSQSDPHPEASPFKSGPEDHHDMMTGVQGERVYLATTISTSEKLITL